MSIFDKVYTLTNRVIDYAKTPDGLSVPPVPCIFCGSLITHCGDGGPGYLINAMYRGKAEEFMYCDDPPCWAAAKFDDEIWRCGCVPDYIEMVGDECTACRRPRRDAIPYNWDIETCRIAVDNIRAVVLDEVYKLLPSGKITLIGDDPYVGLLGGTLASTGSFERPAGSRVGMLRADHINKMPVETLVALRRLLRERFPDRKPVARPELSESIHAVTRIE